MAGRMRGSVGKKFRLAKSKLTMAIAANDTNDVLKQYDELGSIAARTRLPERVDPEFRRCAAYLAGVKSNDATGMLGVVLDRVSLRLHILRKDPEAMKLWAGVLLKLLEDAEISYPAQPYNALRVLGGVRYIAEEAGLGKAAEKQADIHLDMNNEPAIMAARTSFDEVMMKRGRKLDTEEGNGLFAFNMLDPLKDFWRNARSSGDHAIADFFRDKFTALYATLFSMYGTASEQGLRIIGGKVPTEYSTPESIRNEIAAHVQGLLEKPPQPTTPAKKLAAAPVHAKEI